MLKRLHINNYALIEEVNVAFPDHLTIVTGETGAGKSIFLEALSLVLGARADVNTLQDKTRKCIVEAEFLIGNYHLEDFFTANELDYEASSILRREINPEGKSRAFINDSPVSLTLLKQLGEKLVDVHSQHQTLLLNETSFQFDVVDSFAGTQALFTQYKKHYAAISKTRKELADLEAQELQAKKDLDYYQYLFNELEESRLKPGELKQLEEESATLENAESIKSTLLRSSNLISADETNLLSYLSQLKLQLQQLGKFGDTYKALGERVNSLYIEAKDLGNELENAEANVIYDPNRLNEVNTALDTLNRLLKKHNVNSEEELIAIKAGIEEKLRQFGSLEHAIEKIKKELSRLSKEQLDIAADLSAKRKACIAGIEKEVKQHLNELAMPNAIFKIELTRLPEPGPAGSDTLRFLFAANKGNDPKELHKVASGGELSRLMLSLKSLLATKKALPTIIFDEIDTGVSGDVADKIVQILLRTGSKMQVIVITHLPQIASKGSFHLFVYKQDEKNKTKSYIKTLSKDERIVEIAKMLSTGKPTESAIKNAQDLLGRN
ncbi:MAG: DNA repair protein RecN [Bacteroidia bacterium]